MFVLTVTFVDNKFPLLNFVIIIYSYENFKDYTYQGICNLWTQSRAF